VSAPEHVFVAGCGDLGTRVALLFAERGARVTGLRRDPARLPAPIERCAGDLATGAFEVPASVDAIVFAAAPNARGADTGERAALYARTYRDGVANLLSAAPAHARVVFASSTGVYGADDGREVDEDTPPEPATATGRVLLEAEGRVRTAGGTCLRLGGIYGPGRERLLARAREYARGAYAGRAAHRTNRIHADDAARIVEHLLVTDDAPAVLCGVDAESATELEVLAFVAHALGLRTDDARRAADASPSGKRVSSARLRARGFEYRYPTFREGYAALVSAASADPPTRPRDSS